MSNQITSHTEHDEVFALLPWFVNRTLEDKKKPAVVRHLESCRDCQREVQFLETLHKSVESDARDNHRLHADVEMSWES